MFLLRLRKISFMRTAAVCLITAALFAFPCAAKSEELPPNAEEYTCKLFDDTSGLPTAEANAVVQTSDGYLWIGSYGGLVRYDGSDFVNYSKDTDTIIGSVSIRALMCDEGDNIWVGTNDRGVYYYADGKCTRYAPDEPDMFLSVRSFTKDKDGTVYVGTSTGLAVASGEGALRSAGISELEKLTIYTLCCDENGVVWGSDSSGRVFAIKKGKLLFTVEPGDITDDENYSVACGGAGTVYIGTNGGKVIRLKHGGAYTKKSFTSEVFDTSPISTINYIYVAENKEIWLAADYGMGYFDSEMQFRQVKLDGDASFITNITEDYEGNMWLASSKHGVYQCMKGKFYNFNSSSGLTGKSTNAVAKYGGCTYYGTDAGVTIADESMNEVKNELTARLEGVRVRHICVWQDKLLISTYSDEGLLFYDPATGKIDSVGEAQGMDSDQVRLAVPFSDGTIVAATNSGLVVIKDGAVIKAYGRDEGLADVPVLCVCEGENGEIIAGSDGMGMFVIKDGAIKAYGASSGLEDGVIMRIVKDGDGYWVSAGSCIYFWDGASFTNYGNIAEADSVFDIKLSGEDMWILKSGGVINVKKSDFMSEQKSAFVNYGVKNGMTGSVVANSWGALEDGVLYICTTNGVSILDTQNVPQNDIPPKAIINSVTAENSSGEIEIYPADLGEVITVKSDTTRLTIDYAALTYGCTTPYVEYRLEGFDPRSTTVSVDEVSSVSYTNLKGGEYTFTMTAINEDGIRSDAPVTITINKIKAPLENWYVVAALIAAIAVAVIITVRLYIARKTKALKKRQAEYRSITEQALKTIANTIDAKDTYTNGHSLRVAEYSKELARRMGLSEEEQENVYFIALLHDIGKIGVPDGILNKPGKLTDEEWKVIQSHPKIGGAILKDFTALPDICDGARYHHERYDGKGYNDGRSGEDIPLVARIICVADAYDAMNHSRVYRDGMSREKIVSELEKGSGTQFDPKIVRFALDMIEDGYKSNIK